MRDEEEEGEQSSEGIRRRSGAIVNVFVVESEVGAGCGVRYGRE